MVSVVLAPWKPVLRALADSGAKVDAMLGQLAPSMALGGELAGLRNAPRDAARLARELLQRAEAFDLVAHLLNVDEDVLGAYSFGGAPGIRLYRSVIGLGYGLSLDRPLPRIDIDLFGQAQLLHGRDHSKPDGTVWKTGGTAVALGATVGVNL